MTPPPSGRGAGSGWRRLLPGASAAGKGLALVATLAFVTLVGMRAGPAASRPVSADTPAAAPPEASAPAALATLAPSRGGDGAASGKGAAPASSIAAPASSGEAPAAGATAVGVLPDGRVVLNVASEDELTRLPGVGPTRAKAIAALRTRLGRFRSLNDLRRVKGIGRRSLERLRPHAVLDAPAQG